MGIAICFFVLVFADQITKALAFALCDFHVLIPVVGDIFGIYPMYNTGAAFGWLSNEAYARILLIVITCVALVILLILILRLPRGKRFLRYSVTVIAAGATGNLIDRTVEGSVRDFINVSIGDISFLNFTCNVADIAITVGVVMLILDLLFVDQDSIFRSGKTEKKEQAAIEEAAAALSGEKTPVEADGEPTEEEEPAAAGQTPEKNPKTDGRAEAGDGNGG